MRWLPFVAWILAVAALILSLITLLAGVTGDALENAAILTFNVSYLGLTDYHDSNSAIGKNIHGLVPQDVASPLSITQYLGARDWYSMHYSSICEGFWAPDPSGATLSSVKVNITCTRQSAGYSFCPNTYIQNELKPSVQELANEVTVKTCYNTAAWIGLWIVGIIAAVIDIILIPFTFQGTRRINMYTLIISAVSYICFNISAGLARGSIANTQNKNYGPYPLAFLALAFSGTACMIVAAILVNIELRFQRWTFKGQPITTYRKPKHAEGFVLEELGKPGNVGNVYGNGTM